jgi:GNAT superfamily N-acetyltransferase
MQQRLRHASKGQGIGRRLIEHVHLMSREDSASEGVTLTTADEANVALYQHFGYEIVGHASVGWGLRSWGLFRPDAD